MPFASFVIPVYRTERYLKRCLGSLVAQTDGDFEAVVVDDASPDGGAAEIVAALRDPRLRSVRHETNRSTFQAKATGAAEARGEYVLPLDSDDTVRPELVARVKAEAVAAGSPDVVCYNMAKTGGRGRLRPVKYNHPAARVSGEEALEKLLSGRIFMPVCGKAIRRDVFLAAYRALDVGPDFYLNFTDDLCWLLPILFNSRRVSFVDYLGYVYWRHGDSMTTGGMGRERLELLSGQCRRSVAAVAACAERMGMSADTVGRVRDQICPTVRWLMRDMGQSRADVVAAFGEETVRRTEELDSAAGGRVRRLLRHLRVYGPAATAREVVARLLGEEDA